MSVAFQPLSPDHDGGKRRGAINKLSGDIPMSALGQAPPAIKAGQADAPTNSRFANRSSTSRGDMCLEKARNHQFIISCSQFGRDSKF